MNGRRSRYVLWVGLVAVLVIALGYAFWPRPIPVDVGRVTQGPMQVTVDEEGETRIHDVYMIYAPIAGDLGRIDLEAGDPVTAGETIVASLHPADPTLLDARSQAEREATVRAALASVALAEADLKRAKAELSFANSDLARYRKLKPGTTISPRQLERAEIDAKAKEAAVAAAQATLEMRRSELETARAGLIVSVPASGPGENPCCVEVKSPVSGRVLRVLRQSEGVVGTGEPLVEIGKSDNLEVVVDLLSTDAVKVSEGAPVAIGGWGGGVDLPGHVRRVEPYGFTKVSALGIEEQRVNVIIDFDDPKEALRHLGHGYRVEAHILVWRKDNVVQAPLGALFREGERWATFVVAGGAARLRQIDVGRMNTATAEILSGLKSGDQLVLHPPDKITDGIGVKARVQPGPVTPYSPDSQRDGAPSSENPSASSASDDAASASSDGE